MDNKAAYGRYFTYRGVSPAEYEGYRLPDYLLGILPVSKQARILDIGCGFGQMLNALKQRGHADLTGVDVSPQAVAHCRQKGLTVIQIESLEKYAAEIGDSKFDFIIMSHVLEHLPKESVIRTLGLIRQRLMKADGQLVLMVPNAQSNTGCYWAYEDFTHTLLFTAGSISYCLRDAGFGKIAFLDLKGVEGLSPVRRYAKLFLLKLYEINFDFWNKITTSSFHKPSVRCFTYELKVLAAS